MGGMTDLTPIHILGPKRNGLLASRLSVQAGSIQRSGRYVFGSEKFFSECVTLHICTPTVVYDTQSVSKTSFILQALTL